MCIQFVHVIFVVSLNRCNSHVIRTQINDKEVILQHITDSYSFEIIPISAKFISCSFPLYEFLYVKMKEKEKHPRFK